MLAPFQVTVLAVMPMVLKLFTNRKLVTGVDLSSLKEVWVPGSVAPSGLVREISNRFKFITRNALLLAELSPVAAMTVAGRKIMY